MRSAQTSRRWTRPFAACAAGGCSSWSPAIRRASGWRLRSPASKRRSPVQARGKIYYANCVWDAYGVAAALHEDAVVETSDGWTGEPIVLEVRDQRPVLRGDCVAHFAVPAAHWWDDLIYT